MSGFCGRMAGVFAGGRRAIAPWLLAFLTGGGPMLAVPPSREVVKRHVDRSIMVHGRYAAVRLPVTRGVPLWNPTAIRVSPEGTVFVANYAGEILRLEDSDGDGLEDTAKLFADVRAAGLRHPTSLALRGREVFVATAQEIRVYEDADGDGVAERSRTFVRGFPVSDHAFDWVFGLTFDRAGRLHFSLSTDSYNPAPAPDPQGLRGSLLRVQPDGSGLERVATGLRYPYGMALSESGELYFSDNKGGGNMSEEVNRLVPGAFYGHNPDKFPGHPAPRPPWVSIRYGYATVGLAFNPSTNDFGGTGGDLFVATWGPDFRWERGAISRVHVQRRADGTEQADEFRFAHEVPKVSDLTFGPQGDLYVAQFGREGAGHVPYEKPTGGVYRFIHAPWYTPPPGRPPYPVVAGNAVRGRELFGTLSCSSCHSVGETREMLGPDLAGIGDMFSEEEVLNAIVRPWDGIKSGHEAVEVELKDGEKILGRVLRADQERIVMLQAGSAERVIPQSQVLTNRMLGMSLMPIGLLDSCSATDVDDLLAYLQVRRPVGWERWRGQAVVTYRTWRARLSRGQKIALGLVLFLGAAMLGRWIRRRFHARRPGKGPGVAESA